MTGALIRRFSSIIPPSASPNYILRRIITSLEKTRQLPRGLQSREETLESQVEERTRALAEQQEALNATVAEQQRLLETVRQNAADCPEVVLYSTCTKFSNRRMPSAVRIESGWNYTPMVG